MDEFERTILEKFPDFPGYRTGEQTPEIAREWYTAYQKLVEWLHERSRNAQLIREAEKRIGQGG